MDDLKAEIGTIVGCNSEVTNDTHDELCEQIYELVQRQVKLCNMQCVSASVCTAPDHIKPCRHSFGSTCQYNSHCNFKQIER